MKPQAEITIQVPFHDVDMLRIVWHGHYYKYFELARTELFRKFHLDVSQLKALGYYLPISDSSCRYVSPLKYGMQVRITATLHEWEYRFQVKYLIRDPHSGKRLAKGATTQVTVVADTNTLCMVTPEILVAKFLQPMHPTDTEPDPQVQEPPC